MAIVNCTPDSFYPPSRSQNPDYAAAKALEAQEQGADIIDFGAESTRPLSQYIAEEEEIDRLIPVLKAFRKRSPLPVSVDTRRAFVAAAALDEGADIINDISALEDPAMALLCAKKGAPVIRMHMKGKPATMQESPVYSDVISEVKDFLLGAADKAAFAGVTRDKIILDPGIGFGKTLNDNIILLSHLAEITQGDYPVLVGLSRKSFIGELLSGDGGLARDVNERLAGTLAANAAALFAGAAILRVHDTRETVDLVKVIDSIVKAGAPGKEKQE
jgi:dihydropteroate synthase